MKEKGVKLLAALALASMALLLAGCDPAIAPPDWRARVVEGALQISICRPISGSEISVDLEQATGERWREIWNATGSLSFAAGDILQAGALSNGMTNQMVDLSGLTNDSQIIVFLYSGDDLAERAPIKFSSSSHSGYWTDPRGDTFADSCS